MTAAEDLAALSPETRTMAMRALAAMAIWHDHSGLVWDVDPGDGCTTGDLAAFLYVKPMTPGRKELETALSALRRAGLTHYETGAPREPMRWWLTMRGLAVAKRLPVGRSGFERATVG